MTFDPRAGISFELASSASTFANAAVTSMGAVVSNVSGGTEAFEARQQNIGVASQTGQGLTI